MTGVRPNLLSVASLAMAFALLPALPGAAATSTSIITTGHIGGGWPYFSTSTPGGPTTITSTHHFEADTAEVSPGILDGQGEATFAELKARVFVDGPSAEYGSCEAVSGDYWTVTHPALTGTQGTMQLAFDVTGAALVRDSGGSPVTGDDSFAAVRLQVAIGSTWVLLMNEYIPTGSASFMGVAGSPSVTDSFTFTYGTPFQVTTRLLAFGDPNNYYVKTDLYPLPFFIHYASGSASEVTVDFMNTATLRTIAIPGSDGSTQLQTESLTDYQSLIGTAIIPEPTTLAMLAFGGAWLLRRRAALPVSRLKCP